MRRADWHALVPELVVFLASLAFVAGMMPEVGAFLIDGDQGNQLAKATQIALGRHPFADFHNGVYGPLVFYSSYLGQLLSGGRAIGEVAILLVGYASAYTLLFHLLRSVTGQTWTALGLLALALLLLPRLYKYYIVLGPVLFVAGLRARVLGAGSLASLALVTDVLGLYRLDFGVYALAVATLCIVLEQRADWRSTLPRFAGWCLLFASPWLLFLVTQGNPLRMLADSIQTARGVATGLALALPPLAPAEGLGSSDNRFLIAFWYVCAVPFLTLLGVGVAWRRFEEPGQRLFGLGLASFAALVFVQASHRVGLLHLMQVLPVQVLLLAWLATRVAGTRRLLVPALCAIFVLPLALLVDVPQTWAGFDLSGEKLRGLRAPKEELRRPELWPEDSAPRLMASVAQQVQRASDPDSGTLLLPYVPQLYWLADRGFTAPFGWLNPGRFRDRADQEDFVQAMRDTRIVADAYSFRFDRSPQRNARVYADVLMHHIYERYAIFRRIDSFFLLTDDPALLARHATFPKRFRPALGMQTVREPSAGERVTSVNTLAASPETPATSVRGGGLALRVVTTLGDPVVGVGLRRGDLLFVVHPAARRPQDFPGSNFVATEVFGGTGELPAGTYDILVLRAPPGQRPTAYDTGQDVRLIELEALPR